MIIVRLLGGLGNQLFQYAVGRRLAYVNNDELKLDLSFYNDYPLRKYELNNFNIRASVASIDELEKYSHNRLKNWLNSHFKMTQHHKTVNERYFHFAPEILSLFGNVLLEGYWQSEKYFKDIENVIRKDFELKTPSDPYNQEIAFMIQNKTAVNIHVRRGDYVSNPTTNQIHGVCSKEYYNKALQDLALKVSGFNVFIFSDDIPWVKDNLEINYPVIYVERNSAERAHEDLRLMSLCNHHIIANSSFSWWGAWLCNDKDKIVYAPKSWFRSGSNDTKDLLPESWITL